MNFRESLLKAFSTVGLILTLGVSMKASAFLGLGNSAIEVGSDVGKERMTGKRNNFVPVPVPKNRRAQ